MNKYNFIFDHNILSKKDFDNLNIQSAYPCFNFGMKVYEGKKRKHLYFMNIEISFHVYCCGSINFQDYKFKLINKTENLKEEIINKICSELTEIHIYLEVSNTILRDKSLYILEFIKDNA